MHIQSPTFAIPRYPTPICRSMWEFSLLTFLFGPLCIIDYDFDVIIEDLCREMSRESMYRMLASMIILSSAAERRSENTGIES